MWLGDTKWVSINTANPFRLYEECKMVRVELIGKTEALNSSDVTSD